MLPSAPALAWMEMSGVGAVTSCRVPVSVAFSAPSGLDLQVCGERPDLLSLLRGQRERR